jgi:hypothetical protein
MRSAVTDIRRSVLPIYHQHQVFISLLDGKTPLSFWLLALSRVSSQGDPLLAARILSVACGMVSGWLLFAIGTRLAGPAAGLITSALYAILPFGLFYDRIAYTESYVNLTGITLAYVSLLKPRGKPGAPDPILGPPADAMYAYLNQRDGIRVYDAWWTQLYDSYPILPPAPKLVTKSLYERIPAGALPGVHLSASLFMSVLNSRSVLTFTGISPSYPAFRKTKSIYFGFGAGNCNT